jgi:hypothetical protein
VDFVLKIITGSNGNTINIDFYLFISLVILLFAEWRNRMNTHGLVGNKLNYSSKLRDLLLVSVIFWMILVSSLSGGEVEFIYFQF